MEAFKTMINTGGFADAGTDASGVKIIGNLGNVLSKFFYGIGFILLLMFIHGMASARLSYCYNISIGNTEGVAFLFAILCFLFPSLYFPYYSFILNPTCYARSGFMGGGRSGSARRR
jgi:hypothetical protein